MNEESYMEVYGVHILGNRIAFPEPLHRSIEGDWDISIPISDVDLELIEDSCLRLASACGFVERMYDSDEVLVNEGTLSINANDKYTLDMVYNWEHIELTYTSNAGNTLGIIVNTLTPKITVTGELIGRVDLLRVDCMLKDYYEAV